MKKLAILSLFALAAAPVFRAETVGTLNPPAPPPVAAKVLDLLDELRNAQAHKGDPGANVTFKLTDSEANDYLRYALKTTRARGVESVTIKFFPKDYISTFTKVDFDAVERRKPGTIPAVLRPFLKGKKTILIDVRLKADNASMTFSVEKAAYDAMALPAFFVEKMIQILAARQPEKYDTAHPMTIPFGVVKVWTGQKFIEGHN